jgi:D-tyrosyl-tRNA(Tyr) deacylase
MRMVIQRVSRASVSVDGRVAGAIDSGLVILLGVAKQDTQTDAEYLAEKALGLRIFKEAVVAEPGTETAIAEKSAEGKDPDRKDPDKKEKMNRNVLEAGGSLLVISQFTLYGDVRKGRRPSFDRAAPPEQARVLYDYFVERLRLSGARVETGIFQAMMEVELVNEGPVTILVDSERLL